MLLDLDMEYENTYADFLKTRARIERILGVHDLVDLAAH
jgi:hypothetical protein